MSDEPEVASPVHSEEEDESEEEEHEEEVESKKKKKKKEKKPTVELAVKMLEKALDELPQAMRILTLALRSLYAEDNVGTGDEVLVRFQEMRDSITRDALVYEKIVIPMTVKLMRHLLDYLDYYLVLEFDEWIEFFGDINEELQDNKAVGGEVLRIHNLLKDNLKARKTEAKKIAEEFQDLTAEYETKKAELESKAATKEKWAAVLAMIPIVGPIASPMISLDADEDLAEAVALNTQVEICHAASMVVKDVLLKAFGNVIRHVSAVATFFTTETKAIGQFAQDEKKRKTKKVHFLLMKEAANKCRPHGDNFFGVIPAVTTDLQSIEFKEEDKNYVQKWVEREKEAIKEQFGKEKKKIMQKLLAGLTTAVTQLQIQAPDDDDDDDEEEEDEEEEDEEEE